MATVINNPDTSNASGGWSVAIIVLAVLVLGVLAFFVFGNGFGAVDGGTQVNVPVNLGGDTAQ